jgi:hypothetical protein
MNESVATPIVANTKVARTDAAERMRRYRQRRRAGLRCYRLELRASEIEALVRRGLLLASERTNRNAIIKAMYSFLDRTFWTFDVTRNRATCDAQRKAAWWGRDLSKTPW